MRERNLPRNSQPELIETMSRGAAVPLLSGRSHHIGSKDFPMPEKTHRESWREAASLPLLVTTRLDSNSVGGR